MAGLPGSSSPFRCTQVHAQNPWYSNGSDRKAGPLFSFVRRTGRKFKKEEEEEEEMEEEDEEEDVVVEEKEEEADDEGAVGKSSSCFS